MKKIALVFGIVFALTGIALATGVVFETLPEAKACGGSSSC
jgi:hypothetical protein